MIPADGETDGWRVYDWWSRHTRALDVLYGVAFLGRERAFRRRSLEALGLEDGERVLEMGCGIGNAFEALRAGVGDGDRVIGLDASDGIVAAARDRVREPGGRTSTTTRRRPPPAAGGRAVRRRLRRDVPQRGVRPRAGCRRRAAARAPRRLVVLDAQPFQRWPARLLNAVVVPVAKQAIDWVPEVDLPAAIRREFETASVTTFHGGSLFVAVGWKSCHRWSNRGPEYPGDESIGLRLPGMTSCHPGILVPERTWVPPVVGERPPLVRRSLPDSRDCRPCREPRSFICFSDCAEYRARLLQSLLRIQRHEGWRM